MANNEITRSDLRDLNRQLASLDQKIDILAKLRILGEMRESGIIPGNIYTDEMMVLWDRINYIPRMSMNNFERSEGFNGRGEDETDRIDDEGVSE